MLGLLIWLISSMMLLSQYVHAFGHTPHRHSFLAIIFGDASPVPPYLSLFLVITFLILNYDRLLKGPRYGMPILRSLSVFVPIVSSVFILIAFAL